MKKIKNLILFIVFGGAFLVSQTFSYFFKNYQVNAEILEDGTMEVEEKIDADFSDEPDGKHGIIRKIPKNYTVQGEKFRIFVDEIEVKKDNYINSNDTSEISVQIGDADVLLYGPKKYDITYQTYGLIRNFSGMGYTELYRNVIPPERDTSIQKSSFTFTLPKSYPNLSKEDFLIAVGDQVYENIEDFPGTITRKRKEIRVTYNEPLQAYQGITISVRFPVDYFTLDHERQATLLVNGDDLWFYTDKRNWGSVLAIGPWIFFLLLFIRLMQGRFKERVKNDEIIKTEFSLPAEISALEAGVLSEYQIEPKMISALFYDWIRKKYVKLKAEPLKNGEKYQYSLEKIADMPKTEEKYERNFFDDLFEEGNIFDFSHVSASLGRTYATLMEDLEKDLNKKKRYSNFGASKAFKEENITLVLSFFFGTLIFCPLRVDYLQEFFFFPLYDQIRTIFFGILIGILSQFRTYKKETRTKKGKELSTLCKGYKLFIKQVDEQKLKTLLAEDPLFFEKTLPFAAAFGLETDFIKKVTPLLPESTVENGDIFYHMTDISSLLTSYNVKAGSYVSSASYSSSGGFSSGSSFGGGFSGGGGGGGGGGSSW